MLLLKRPRLLAAIRDGLAHAPVTAIFGARQCGKTTLARQVAGRQRVHTFDLESPSDLRVLQDAEAALAPLRGLVVLDEIQRQPVLFELLRVLADRRPRPARFLILGSTSPAVLRGASESLAGRVRHVDVGGFELGDLGRAPWQRLWERGGFPASYLARDTAESLAWRQDFLRSFVERDLGAFELRLPSLQLRRFLGMLSHYHGGVYNANEMGASLGVSQPTARKLLDLSCGAFFARQLAPYHVNLGKRLVKSPKVYLRDSGLFHALLGVEDLNALRSHPKLGASWEGFCVEQVLALCGDRQAYFWAVHNGPELDLLIEAKGRRWGFEFKAHSAPELQASARAAMQALDLEQLYVIHSGERSYRLAPKVEALPLAALPAELKRRGLTG